MKRLITGANGFIGQHLVRYLLKAYPRDPVGTLARDPVVASPVKAYSCDLLDENALAKAVADFQPDEVYHLAGHSRVADTFGIPDYFAKNFLMSLHLIRALKARARPTRVFFASSVHVYGNQAHTVDESFPPQPISPYGFTKYLAEEAFRVYSLHEPWLSVVVARLYSCVGPGQGEGFVASDLCRRIAKLPDEPGAVLKVGPLSGYRQFLDVRDAVRLFPSLLGTALSSRFEVFNIASSHELQISHILNLLLRISGKSPKVESFEDAASNPFTGLRVDSQKLEKCIPLASFRPIEETLQDLYQWVDSGLNLKA